MKFQMSMADKVRELREAKGWSQEELASRVGVSQVAIAKIESGQTKRTRFLNDLADILDTTPDELRGVVKVRPSKPIQVAIFGDRDLPIFASVEAGDGAMVVHTDPIDHVVRPWFMRGVKEGYAVLVSGSSMEPVFAAGDMAIVNPRLPYQKGKDHIFVSGEDVGEFNAVLKRLIDWTSAEWVVRQFSPPEGREMDFRLLRATWPKALRVVGKYDGG